jgi:hypothetical protein
VVRAHTVRAHKVRVQTSTTGVLRHLQRRIDMPAMYICRAISAGEVPKPTNDLRLPDAILTYIAFVFHHWVVRVLSYAMRLTQAPAFLTIHQLRSRWNNQEMML